MPTPASSAGSRKVEPRKRKRSPSDNARNLRRRLAKAVRTSSEIQGKSRRRQRSRAAGEANFATSLDTDLRGLYEIFGDDKRDVFATGKVPDGTPYRGRTWRAS